MRNKSSAARRRKERTETIREGNDAASALNEFFHGSSHPRALCVCIDAFDGAALLPHESVDLILTSPPYWGLRTYGLDHNWEIDREWKGLGHSIDEQPGYEWYRSHGGVLGLEPTPEWFVAHLAEFYRRLHHALKPRGSVWVNLGDTYFARWSSIRTDVRALGKTCDFAGGHRWGASGRKRT